MELRSEIDFRLWNSIHELPRFLVKKWQLSRLKNVVSIAYNSVPMYRKYWQHQGFKPSHIRSLEDIRLIPIVNKSIFRSFDFEETVHADYRSMPRDKYEWLETTGSTGEPFRIINAVSPKDSRYRRVSEYKFLLWEGFDLDEVYNNMRIAQIRVNPHPTPHYLFVPVSSLGSNAPETLQKLYEFKPDILNAAPTVLTEFARIAEKLSRTKIPSLKYVISHSEILTDESRRYIENIFGGEMYDHYGSVEVGWIGIECREHNGLHVSEESLVTEIVSESGMPVEDGRWGRVIVTFFFNSIMPFIRYDTGDWGVFLPGSCPCGITAKRLKVQGRIGAYLDFGSKRFYDFEIRAILRGFGESIVRYQIIKTARDRVEIFVIPTKKFSLDDKNKIINLFDERFGFKPEVVPVNFISNSPQGKTITIIDQTLVKSQPVFSSQRKV